MISEKSLYFKDKRMLNLLVLLLLFNSIIDSIIMNYSDRDVIIILQYSFNILFLAVFFSNYRFKKYGLFLLMFLLMGYFTFLSFFSSDYMMTFNYLA